MDDYKFGAPSSTKESSNSRRASQESLPYSSTSSRRSSRHIPNPSTPNSARRASVPLFAPTAYPHSYQPSAPSFAAYRHRQSVSSVTTTGTSTSTSGSINDEPSFVLPVTEISIDTTGTYGNLQTYVFGSSSQPSASSSSAASSSLYPSSAGPSSRRIGAPLSRQSSSTTGMGITVGAAVTPSGFLNDFEDNDMANNSDVGSAYSPEDDAGHVGPPTSKRRSRPTDHDRMDVDLDQKLSKEVSPSSSTNRSSRSPRAAEKKRERGGYARVGPTTSVVSKFRNETHETDDPTTDEDDSNRGLERSKMRAIDDGGRRPSLPSNVHHSVVTPMTAGGTSSAGLLLQGSPVLTGRTDGISSPTSSGSPSTPTATTFGTLMSAPIVRQGPISTVLAISSSDPGSRSSSSPINAQSSLSRFPSPSPASPSTKTRPRSRSTRAAKPLPTIPTNEGINNWVAPWSATAASAGRSSITPPPLGLPPPGHNPFLPPSAQARLSSDVRSRSGTITQTPGSSISSPRVSAEAGTHHNSRSPNPFTSPDGPHFTSTPPSPPPEEGTAATADFDLAFILSGNSTVPANLSPDYGTRKASLAPSIEDTFVRFVNKFDDEYGERRDKWSYRIERPSESGFGSGDYWRCENMGRYWVGKEPILDDGVSDGFAPDSLICRFCPTETSDLKGKGKERAGSSERLEESSLYAADTPSNHSRTHSLGSSGASSTAIGSNASGPISPTFTPSQRRSNVRVQIKKRLNEPTFMLYFGPRVPRSVQKSRPTILLAPKHYHFQHSAPPKYRVTSNGGGHRRVASNSGAGEFDKLYSTSLISPLKTSGFIASQVPINQGRAASALARRVTSGNVTPTAKDFDLASIEKTNSRLGRSQTISAGVLPQETPAVSLDQVGLAAATGRITSVHNQAFDTLSPEDGQAVLEHLRTKSSLGVRLKRAFGGMGSGSKVDPTASVGSTHSHTSSHSEFVDGREGRSSSPLGKLKDHHGKDDAHHPIAPHEGAFQPPWMLMTPLYVKEAVYAAERSMYTGFASLGLAAPPANSVKNGSKKGKHIPPPIPTSPMGSSARRNSVLDNVPAEALCMVLPLWDMTLDIEEDRRKRRQIIDDLDLDLDDLDEEEELEEEEEEVDEILTDTVNAADPEAVQRKRLLKELARRRKLMPPPKQERKYLLAYYVPFNAKRQSIAGVSAPGAPSNERRTSKKRPRAHGNTSNPHAHLGRRNSGSATPASSAKPHVPSFRVVCRILSPADLRESGLDPPRNIVDPKRMQQQSGSYYHSSLNYQRMDRRLSSSSIFGENVPSSFSAVIAVCHDRRRGVEFVPEGLDSLGLCGGETVLGPNGAVEKLPPLFPPAHMVPVSERRTPPLNAVGRQIVEMIWAGCLAVTELGVE